MIHPTGSDKILTIPPEGGAKTQTRRDDSLGKNSSQGTETSAAPNRGDRIEVSQAARIVSQTNSSPTGRSAANINTPEQASKLASRIVQQFQRAGAQGLQAQSGIPSEQLANLLQGAPA